MAILSIDVGIKNLAFCLLDDYHIYKWDVVSLIESEKHKCQIETKGKSCISEAKYTKDGKYYCLKHAKKEEYIIPSSEIKSSFVKKLDITKLKALADNYSISYDPKIKKKELTGEVIDYFENRCFDPVCVTNASDVDLITIGRSLKRVFDQLLTSDLNITCVVIENQISPIANRMKTLQGMIAQYFIMKDDNISIEFVSSVNKLKVVRTQENKEQLKEIGDTNTESNVSKEVLTYNQRKRLGVEKCSQLIKEKNYTEWYQFFLNNKKKDDLSDSFLQGIWFIEHNKT